MRLILASRSPRRLDIMRLLGLEPETMAADVDEDAILRRHPTPRPYVMASAAAKAEAVATMVADGGEGGGRRGGEAAPRTADGGTIVLGADTTVVLAGRILNKPADAADARTMLAALTGREHEVLTGVCVLRVGARETWLHAARTIVQFRELDDATIARYVATGSPLDKAGAYGIQDHGAEFPLIASVRGDYWNVMGLPVEVVREGLAHFGIPCGPAPAPPRL